MNNEQLAGWGWECKGSGRACKSMGCAQAINYMEAYNTEVGLLINFGETSLTFKRLTNKKYRLAE